MIFVDDEIYILDGLRRSMRAFAAQWDLEFFSTPEAALRSFAVRPAQVVVTDLKMPGMDGITMINAMRRSDAACRFIMLTGTADLRAAMAAINSAEVFRFFTKPCETALLVEAIRAAFDALMQSELGQTALDLLPVGVLVVDAESRLLFMNKPGGELIAAADGLSLGRDGKCLGSTHSETVRLQALVRRAVGGDSGAVTLSRRAAAPLSVVVAPLDGEGSPAPRIALYVTDPDDRPLPSVEVIGTLLGLTSAEARLAHALAQGQSLDEVAESVGITVGTARGYLKQIFEKTGRSRQADLIRLVLSIPAIAP